MHLSQTLQSYFILFFSYKLCKKLCTDSKDIEASSISPTHAALQLPHNLGRRTFNDCLSIKCNKP